MKAKLTLLTLAAVFAAGVASAEDHCYEPMSNWQPREAVTKLAEDNGWTLRRVRIDDGCYKIYGQDAEGRAIEVTINPATLEQIDFEFEGEKEHHGHKKDGERHD